MVTTEFFLGNPTQFSDIYIEEFELNKYRLNVKVRVGVLNFWKTLDTVHDTIGSAYLERLKLTTGK
jgi:hypothetical protein